MSKSDAIKVIEMLEKKGNVTVEEIKEVVGMIDEPISYQPAPIIVKPWELPNTPNTPNILNPCDWTLTWSTDKKTTATL